MQAAQADQCNRKYVAMPYGLILTSIDLPLLAAPASQGHSQPTVVDSKAGEDIEQTQGK